LRDLSNPVAVLRDLPESAREILRGEVGSSAHGVNLPGSDDFDMMAIVVERPEVALGTKEWEHKIYRSAEEREGKKNVPSQAGDIDLSIFSLRKFARLAAQGNPNVQMMFYGPTLHIDHWGKTLRLNHKLFASKQVIRRFLGYMKAQKQRLQGERGQMRTTRTALVEKYGYDTKYAMHVLRLGFQGIMWSETGHMPVPLGEFQREYLLHVRQGKFTFEEIIGAAEYLEAQLLSLLDKSTLPEEPNFKMIDQLLNNIYRDVWKLEAL
jgi:uncharacterized protein